MAERSPNGSQTHMALSSCLGTWPTQGFNPFLHCLALLSLQTHEVRVNNSLSRANVTKASLMEANLNSAKL